MPIRRRTSTGSTVGVVQVGAVVQDLALDAGAVDQIVHPVEAAQERRLAAADGPISAVISLRWIGSVTSRTARKSP